MKMKPSLFRSVFVKCLAISALVLGLHSQKAEAKIINLYLDLYPGLTLSPSAFSLPTEENYNGDDLYHSQTSANSLGFHLGGRAGLDALIFTAQLRFDQYLDVTDGSRFSGTLGQLVGGLHFAVIDNESLRFHLNILGGLVFGLGLNPQYPIDRDQISKFGFTGELEGLFEVPITKRVFSFFASLVVGYHVTGFDSVRTPSMDELQNNPHGFHVFARAGFRFNLLGF